jgi:long-chain fatty acid transport protein
MTVSVAGWQAVPDVPFMLLWPIAMDRCSQYGWETRRVDHLVMCVVSIGGGRDNALAEQFVANVKKAMFTRRTALLAYLVPACLIAGISTAHGQGVVLPGVGPINRSMAGATVGAPLDAAGAMHWNPAAIAGLHQSEIMFGAEFLYPRTELSSTFPNFGSASDDSNSGVAVMPLSAIVCHADDSAWSWGLGLYGIGGFGVNYPANPRNPVLSPPPSAGIGAGAVFSRLALAQIAPTAAVWITDRLAIGLAPTFTMADLGLDPALFASPDDANGDGFPTYPAATHARLHWGMGFQVGLYYQSEGPWSAGASLKSPQWFEKFRFNASDELGNPRDLGLNLDYPMIVSVGAGYRPCDCITWATDIRYVNYRDTDGFGDTAGFDATGAVTGLGWRSVMSVGTGVHYQLTESTSVRLGYLFNENPVPSNLTSFNIASSPIFQHAVFLGASQRLSSSVMVSLSYVHLFDNSIRGPFETPLGAVPGASVQIDQVIDALAVAIHVFF